MAEAKAKDTEKPEEAKTEAEVTEPAEAEATEKAEAKAKDTEEAMATEMAEAEAQEISDAKAKQDAEHLKWDAIATEMDEAEPQAKAKDEGEAVQAKTEAEVMGPAEAKATETAEGKAKDTEKPEEAKTEAEATELADAEAKATAEAKAKDTQEAEEAKTEVEVTEPAEAEAKEKAEAQAKDLSKPEAEEGAQKTKAETSEDGAKKESMATKETRDGQAVGDPHLRNIHGERFDLMRPGNHLLLDIPRGKPDWFLRVEAQVRRMGSQCADMYFRELNITGKWVDTETKTHGGIFLQAQGGKDKNTKLGSVGTLKGWNKFGPVELKVANGHTDQGVQYLNFYVKHLGSVGYVIGGLLGEDDHTDAATPTKSCNQVLSLSRKASPRSHTASAPSVAEASLE